jgi:hypothetical protein
MDPAEKEFTQDAYTHAIDSDDIHTYLSSDAPDIKKERVHKLQYTKEAIIKGMRHDLQTTLTYNHTPTNNRKYKKYLQQFEKAKELIGKYMYYALDDLEQRVQSPRLSIQEKNEMQVWINLNNKAKEFLKHEEQITQKDILFDMPIFLKYSSLGSSKDNIPCFYEQDTQGNKNYFSLNDLLNDMETFGTQRYVPRVDDVQLKAITPHFPHFVRALKLKNTYRKLQELRDKQEQVMYDLPHYREQHFYEQGKMHTVAEGKLAEKVVEWMFRHFAQLAQEYDIRVIRASIGEDIINKVDLVLEIRNKRTGVQIEKELQLTMNNRPEILEKKKHQLEELKVKKGNDIALIQLVFNDLCDKYRLRWAFGAPVGGLKTMLDLEEKDLLGKTYERIVQELTES